MRKRRRTVPEENATPTEETRASRRRKVKQEVDNDDNPVAEASTEQVNRISPHPGPKCSRIKPPETPITVRKIEIPSSQSPADTPPSIHTIKSVRSPFRSPLKAKSGNARNPPVSQSKIGKAIGRRPKLEVKSSVSWENEDSQPFMSVQPSRTVNRREGCLITSKLSGNTKNLQGGREEMQAILNQLKCTGEVEESAPNTLSLAQRAPPRPLKTEIRDSDAEDDDDEIEEDYGLGNETQAVVQGLISSSEHLQTHSSSSKSDDQNAKSTDQPDPTPGDHDEIERPNSLSSGDEEYITPTTSPHRPNTNPPPASSQQNIHRTFRSESEEVSAQLARDLQHHTQQHHTPMLARSPHLFDSESQFGFVCREYTPALPDNTPDHEDEHERRPDGGNFHTYTNTTSNIAATEELRTSQASTIDGDAHSSPLKPLNQERQFQPPSSQSSPPSLRQSSLPPPTVAPARFNALPQLAPPSLTSDSTIENVTPADLSGEIGEWDGKVLTVSQLLPDSMLVEDECLGGPPAFSSQDWEYA